MDGFQSLFTLITPEAKKKRKECYPEKLGGYESREISP
jgi:hypothetical protein